jgi:hypothetical protein
VKTLNVVQQSVFITLRILLSCRAFGYHASDNRRPPHIPRQKRRRLKCLDNIRLNNLTCCEETQIGVNT